MKTPSWKTDPDLDAPWSQAALESQQKELKDIDVCGAMDICREETCPCFLLNYNASKFCI